MDLIKNIIRFLMTRGLAMPALLFSINIACAVERFSNGDPKRGVYFLSSAVCIVMVSI